MDGAPSTFGEAGVEARLPDSEMLELGGFDERCGGSSPSFSSFSMECKLPLLDVEHVCRQELSAVRLPPAVAAARISARASQADWRKKGGEVASCQETVPSQRTCTRLGIPQKSTLKTTERIDVETHAAVGLLDCEQARTWTRANVTDKACLLTRKSSFPSPHTITSTRNNP